MQILGQDLRQSSPLLHSLQQRLLHLFAAFDRALESRTLWITAACAVLILQFALIFTHHPWLDEWQALQIAVQSPTWPDLLNNLRYEGHPPLWYALLRWSAAFTGPVLGSTAFTLPLVAAVLAGFTQAAILFASPFRRADRLMLAGSEFILFEFLTVSRSLTLGVACAVFVVVLWRRPLLSTIFIALLPLCDFLFGVMSLGFLWLRWRERSLSVPGTALWLVTSLASAWTVRPAADMVAANQPLTPLMGIAGWMANMGAMGIPLQWYGWLPMWNHPPSAVVAAVGLMGFTALVWAKARADRDAGLVMGGLMLVTLVFSIAVYPLAVRHLMLIPLMLILIVWLRLLQTEKNCPGIWFRGWLLVVACCGLFTSAINFAIPFDTAHLAAAEIRRQGLQDRPWVAFPVSSAQGVSALTGIRFERPESGCRQDFVRWNFATPLRSWGRFKRYLHEKARRDGRFYLITEVPLQGDGKLIRKIAQIPVGYSGQEYNMFVVGEGLPERAPALPPCNGPSLPFPQP